MPAQALAPIELAPLLSAQRSATTTSQVYENSFGHTGAYVFLVASAVSGTGGLTVTIEGKDPVSGTWYSLHNDPNALSLVGTRRLYVHPELSSTAEAQTQFTRVTAILPRFFRFKVAHGDNTNYTYSLGVVLLP